MANSPSTVHAFFGCKLKMPEGESWLSVTAARLQLLARARDLISEIDGLDVVSYAAPRLAYFVAYTPLAIHGSAPCVENLPPEDYVQNLGSSLNASAQLVALAGENPDVFDGAPTHFLVGEA